MNTIYRINSQIGTQDYRHAVIEVLDIDRWSSQGLSLGQNEFTMRWQTDSQCDEWYAGKIHMTASSAEGLKRCTDLARYLWNANGKLPSPQEVVDLLETKGITRGVYDSRESEYKRIEDVAPLDHIRWSALDHSYAIVGPADRAVATKLMAEHLAARNLDSFEKWILEGKTLAAHDSYPAPDLKKPSLDPNDV